MIYEGISVFVMFMYIYIYIKKEIDKNCHILLKTKVVF